MTTLREVYDQFYMAELVKPDPITKSPYWLSGAVKSDGKISTLLGIGQQELTIPYLSEIDTNSEPYYSNTIYTDIAVPQGVGASKMKALVAYENNSWLEARLERFLSGQSPLELISQYVGGYWLKQAEHRLVATLVGVRNYDQANGKKITIEKNAVFDVGAFIEAEGTMDAEMRGKGVIVVHPAVATSMRVAKLLIPFQDPATLTVVDVYNGRRVVESTEGTTAKTGATVKYISYLLNDGAFIGESVPGHDDMEVERNGLRANGGGTTVLISRRNMLIHPTGFDFVADRTTLTGGTTNEAISASWADLQKATAWELGAGINTTTQVPFRILITNAV